MDAFFIYVPLFYWLICAESDDNDSTHFDAGKDCRT